MRIKTFIEDKYWPTVKPDLSPAWQRRTGDFLAMIIADLGDHELDALTAYDVDRWWRTVRGRFATPVTPNKILVRVKHIYRTAIRWGDAHTTPFEGIKRRTEPERKFHALGEREETALLTRCGVHLAQYQTFAKYTGARLSSLWRLEERDINLETRTVTFRQTKNGEDYAIPLHSDLERYIAQHGLLTGVPTHRVLHQYAKPGTVSRMFVRLKKKVGVNFRFHDFRHTMGTKIAESGNPKLVQMMLGHKDPRMAMRYTHPSQETLRASLEDAL